MMKNKLFTRSAMLTAILATLFASRVALAQQTEVEPNDPYAQYAPQALTLVPDGNGTLTATVDGSINNGLHRDIDYYSFYGHAGDVVTFNIAAGMDPTTFVGVWTGLAVFGPATDAKSIPLDAIPIASNYLSTNSTSVSPQDARIDNFSLPADGTYVVGVGSAPGQFLSITNFLPLDIYSFSSGNYTLIVSGVTPAAAPAPAPEPTATPQSISIDIMPGRRNVIILSFAANHVSKPGDRRKHGREMTEQIRGHLKGGIPVALLSSKTFTPMDVDQSSLRFGSTGQEESLMRCNSRGIDFNHDGVPDLLCHFDVSKANFQPGDSDGFLTGMTTHGDAFQGEGFLKIMSGLRYPDNDQDQDQDRDRNEHGRRHRR